MGLTGAVPAHPAQFSPEVIHVLARLIEPGERIHDPFAGLGYRLGALCDLLGCPFSGTDIEPWEGRDERVVQGDARDRSTYPKAPFTVATSPVYLGNRISTDYMEGPTPDTKTAGRRAYGISRNEPLDPENMARLCRLTDQARYFAEHMRAVTCWGHRALVNVDSPLRDTWIPMLQAVGFRIEREIEVPTRRYRVGRGPGSERPSHELVIEGVR